MKADRERMNDGRWHALDPMQGREQGVRWVRTPENRFGVRQTFTRRGWRGRVTRMDVESRKWEFDACPHLHTKRSVARTCGEAAARRLNRKGVES